jgi:hypothetical protein
MQGGGMAMPAMAEPARAMPTRREEAKKKPWWKFW